MTNRNENGNALLSVLSATDSVLLFSHISPDGDTLGSALALYQLLSGLGKKTQLVLDGDVPENLLFMPESQRFAKPREGMMPRDSLAIAVDVSCKDRLGAAEALFDQAPMTAVIDHHGTNPGFGQINWVDPDAPATAILVFRLFEALEAQITQEAAICLYTALATDTGNFLYQSVNGESFRMMAALMDAGLPVAKYGRMLFRQKREPFVRLLGATLPSLRRLEGGRISGLRLCREDIQKAGASPADVDGVVDYAIDLSGTRMAYFAHEMEPGVTKVSFRALAPYRIDEAAASFGGGGHQLAAGCTIRLPADEAAQEAEKALMMAWTAQNGGE